MIGTDSAYEFHRMTKYLHISQIVRTALWLTLLLALQLALGVPCRLARRLARRLALESLMFEDMKMIHV